MDRGLREFHVSRKARDTYQFSESLFTLSGNVIFTNYYGARTFAQKINEKRDLINYPEQAVRTSQLIAMGLIDEILHYIVSIYVEETRPTVVGDAIAYLKDHIKPEVLEKTIERFTDEFPPLAVYTRATDIKGYLDGETGGTPNREIALEEMILLWLANMNPAFSPFRELFEDTTLQKDTAYLPLIGHLKAYFETLPTFGPLNQSLMDMLRSPALAVPHSLAGQLEYIMEHWGYLLGKYFTRMLRSLDLFKEEEKVPFLGPGPAQVYRFTGLEFEPERFTPDKDWMPRLVLMAKNIYVWLDQLSKTYRRSITKLNEVPEEELAQLQRRGFTGLWLIGVWERSPSSQKIKQMCGNPEAVPSAYSLYDYEIAADLGGAPAFEELKERATRHAIRLASDMVPNHVGIYSRWVVEHPDWFVSLDQNPYPWYDFNGPDLSHDERVSIQIEDHYYQCTDAAVVFKRRDRWTGSEKYVYHGNDGTSMPWNDTAQLNYLNPEVREAMIQTILHVARQFPVIRFDAAMTLTKKHYQRLWFPEPGTGGAIPTRAEHSLSRDSFNEQMPNEFWREVVDRLAVEAPDTLLLAEAFWLLEGYFVRTLGMHRVYNSAFMNMLRDEENSKYRQVMKNTLEFDPEIMKRFVNFMNNPDERTAVDQFGKEDKYFGACMVMSTLPGLPMFGHGQIEGYAEKYGMEYRRAYWDEEPDGRLIERHEREIFPLLHKRRIFAGVEHFLLYDFFDPDGHVNEDVFAYSNKYGDERSLVVFNNRFSTAKGWIRTSVAFAVKDEAGQKKMVQKSLGEGLAFEGNGNCFTIFRDYISNLEYIRNSAELVDKGLYVELGAYNYHTFLHFREVRDNEWGHYRQICGYLNGRGVPNVEDSMHELFLQPIHYHFRALMNADMLEQLTAVASGQRPAGKSPVLPRSEILSGEIEEKLFSLLREIKTFISAGGDENPVVQKIMAEFKIISAMPALPGDLPKPPESLQEFATENHPASRFAWLFTHALGGILKDGPSADEQSRSWIDEWMLDRIIEDALRELGFDDKSTWESLMLIRIFTSHQHWFGPDEKISIHGILEKFLTDDDVRRFLQINRYQDLLWFNKETFDLLISWMLFTGVVSIFSASNGEDSTSSRKNSLERLYDSIERLSKASQASQFQVSRLLELVR